MFKKLLLLLATIIVIGCSTQRISSDANNSSKPSIIAIVNHCEQFGYCYGVPSNLEQAVGENDVLTFSTKDNDPGIHYSIQPYHLTQLSNCLNLGVSKPNVRLDSAGTKILWGRVDAWDGLDQEGAEYPPNSHEIPCKKEGTPPPKETYSLCSERNGKNVTICVDEMTDNPALAKQIFDSFRWTK